MPAGAEDGILKGLYKFKAGAGKTKLKAHIFGSGPIIREALRAQQILAEKLRCLRRCLERDELQTAAQRRLARQRWNMLHPTEPPRKSYLETTAGKRERARSSPFRTT